MENKYDGLSNEQARQLLAQFGPNLVDDSEFQLIFENIKKVVFDPMGLMLLLLALVYWLSGQFHDSIIMLIVYVPIVLVDVFMELRSRKALSELKKSIKLKCYVIREKKIRLIKTADVVPGDLLVLEEGQTVPADGMIVESSNLTLNESLVTGESLPIIKNKNDRVLSGTIVLSGSGYVTVLKTGFDSQIGKIAKVLKQFDDSKSPLQMLIHKIVRILFIASILLGTFIFVVNMISGHSFKDSLVLSLTLMMAAIPEEFPLVFTLYLSLAAYTLSKLGVLVKDLPSVEGLARVDVICTDKTGTLTEGTFKLENFLSTERLQNKLDDLILICSCEPKPIDAMEIAIFEWLINEKKRVCIEDVHYEWDLQFDYPFETDKKLMSHVWKHKENKKQIIAMKGSLEGVLSYCKESDRTCDQVVKAHQLAGSGKRVLALAGKVGVFDGERSHDEKNLDLIGILSFADPIRKGVQSAILQCVNQGIEVKMLTGDHLLTAHSVADVIGLPHDHDQLYVGSDIQKLNKKERATIYDRGVIFARLTPEQKLELVQELKARGKIVAMTGDGVNDAPALKLADIGISMGDRATDVARATAKLILMKNDFSGIVASIVQGQRVLTSLSQSFGYLISFHIPIVIIALLQSLFFDHLVLKPIHIVLLEFIVHPISSFVFLNGQSITTHKKMIFFSKEKFIRSGFRGILLTVLSLLIPLIINRTDDGSCLLVLLSGNIGLIIAEKGGLLKVKEHIKDRSMMVSSMILVMLILGLSNIDWLQNVASVSKFDPNTILVFLGTLFLVAPSSYGIESFDTGNKDN